jgi:hypothetical protein
MRAPKNTALVLVATCATLLVTEGLFTIGYWVKDGRLIAVSEKLALPLDTPAGVDSKNAPPVAKRSRYFPHPYLGYTFDRQHPALRGKINQYGFSGKNFPKEKVPGTFTLLVTGGSVAHALIGYAPRKSLLARQLNKHYTTKKIRKFVVLNGAVHGWHQPQQLITLALYGHLVDAVVTLDGYNEFREHMHGRSLRMEYPHSLYRTALLTHVAHPERAALLRRDQELRAWQRRNPLLRHSRTAFFVINRLRAKARAAALNNAPGHAGEAFRRIKQPFRLPQQWSKKQKGATVLKSYRKYLRLMHAMAQAQGTKSLFTLQPIPHIDKRLTPEEKRWQNKKFDARLYAESADALTALRSEGLPAYSLLPIFKDITEDIYVDAIHIKKRTPGNRLLTQALLELMEKEWGLQRKRR